MSMYAIILAFFCLLFPKIYTQWTFRQYIVQKDFFTGIKAGEFSIYDQSERNLLYRLESRYAITQSAELYAHPGRRMIASIRNRFSPWIYDADIQIYDFRFNEMVPGKISQNFPGYGFRFHIQYGNRRLIMEQKPFSLTTEIRDEYQINYVLARFRTRLASIVLPNKYDLQVYTDELPDTLYMLALAASDYNHVERSRYRQNTK